jgi:sulfur carrier protein ThiS
MISVRVSEAGGIFATVEMNEDSTVKDALQKANARLDVAKTITVNSQPAELEDIVEHGDTIYVVPNIKGNK